MVEGRALLPVEREDIVPEVTELEALPVERDTLLPEEAWEDGEDDLRPLEPDIVPDVVWRETLPEERLTLPEDLPPE